MPEELPKRVDDVGHHNPRDKVGQEEDGVVDFGHKAIRQLEDDHRQRNRKHQPHHHKEQVVQNRIADVVERAFDIRGQDRGIENYPALPRGFLQRGCR